MKKKSIYLDYAAATPLDPEALEAMRPYLADNFYNPSANYLAAKAVKSALNQARSAVAHCLGAKPPEIIFTAGATEANNLAIQGIMKRFPEGEILISAIEHDSVRAPAWLFDYHEVPVTKHGLVEPISLEKFISDKTVLISIGYVNNEIGTAQPLGEIANLVAKTVKERIKRGVKAPLYLHTDAAQAGCYLQLNTSRLGVDLMSLNGGKIYGPKQTGVLYLKAGLEISPLIGGGGQESGLRAGTENVPGIIGLAAALDNAQARRAGEVKRLGELRELFIAELKSKVPGVMINGSSKHSARHIVSATFAGQDNERLMMELDEAGVQCATGSACHAGIGASSHVLKAIGLTDAQARSTLRFSLGRPTTRQNILETADRIAGIIGRNR